MSDKIPILEEDFIALVKQRPVIWDRTSEYYLNKAATRKAWHKILLVMYPDYDSWDAVKKRIYARRTIIKWTRIKDTFMTSEKKIKHFKMIGQGNKVPRPYIYRQHLLFLIEPKKPKDILQRPKVTTNIQSKHKVDSDHYSDDEEAITYLKDQGTSENSNDSQVQPKPSNVIRKRISTDDSIEAKTIRFVDSFSPKPEPVNRHVSFFKGLLPTLEQFNDDQIIDFQLGVMQLVKSIKCPIQCEVILPAKQAQDLIPCKVEIE